MTLVDAPPARASRPGSSRAVRRLLRWVALAIGVVLLWPPGLGGVFGGVIVAGHSMEPTLQPGDLAITVRADRAEVGDVVVFQPGTQPRARVIHRVVDVDGEHLQLRGDNNDWVDPFDVIQDDVMGKMVLRIPDVGGWVSKLAEPPVWASLLLVGSGWWLLSRRAEREDQ